MAQKQLRTNVVLVDEHGVETWYGPAYPENEVTAEVAKQIGEHAFTEDPLTTGSGDLRFTAADFGVDVSEVPNLRDQEDLLAREAELADLRARATIFGGPAEEVATTAEEGYKREAKAVEDRAKARQQSARRQTSKSE